MHVQSWLHLTEASSLWTQLCTPRPLFWQSNRRLSVPVQATSSRTIGPDPAPNRAKLKAWAPIVIIHKCVSHTESEIQHMYCYCRRKSFLPSLENPSCLQTTFASVRPQPSSHTVPHSLLLQTSTRPSNTSLPPASLTSPCWQTVGQNHKQRLHSLVFIISSMPLA